jgi:hypothetical protein
MDTNEPTARTPSAAPIDRSGSVDPASPSATRIHRHPRHTRAHLPIPRCVGSEPSLIPPYLTDGISLLRIVGRASLGSEMILLVEDCRTLDVRLYTWRELSVGELPMSSVRNGLCGS